MNTLQSNTKSFNSLFIQVIKLFKSFFTVAYGNVLSINKLKSKLTSGYFETGKNLTSLYKTSTDIFSLF